MIKLHLFYATLLFAGSIINAEQIATTPEGKKVTLRDNGTWSYVKESAPDSMTVPADDHTTLVDIIKNDKQFDFRKVKWGMNRKQVMASETVKLSKNQGDVIEYEVQFLSYNCTVVYNFAGDVLVRAAFLIGQDHIDPSLFYTDYENLKKYLVPLYGNPKADRCDWVNEMYRADRAKWGFAVSLGFLSCSTRWEDGRTGMALQIQGGNHAISTRIEYSALKQK